ncbi:MAG: glycosyltransferase [Deltaproteobacteria bacterium]|nr:glycosyltransferase [Deltaproteobacteria bacterium]
MCEAFAQNGLKVILLHPFRGQPDTLKYQNVFDYYGVPSIFDVGTLPNLDIFLFERLFPKTTFAPLFFMHAMLWGLYAVLRARREGADLYYTRESTIAYWLVRLGLPTVYEVHDLPERIRKILLRQISTLPSLKLVVALTSFIKERLVNMGFSPEKIIALPSSTDLSLFSDLPNMQECRERLGLPQERTIIGYIGRFRTQEMEKGIPELVQAMAHLPSLNGSDPLLLCVGGPMDLVPAYRHLAHRCGVPQHRLQFIDRVANQEVPLWIRAFDIAVAPFPYTEHYAYFMSPLKLFEYLAAGMPIVATDLPSIREVLRHGENAWLVEPGNVEALAEGITHLLRDAALKGKIAAEARQSAKGNSWEMRATTILNHVREIS